MKWARFKYRHSIFYGIVEDNNIEVVEGNPFGSYIRGRHFLTLADVELLPPVIPGTFYAVGYNYVAHTEEAKAFLKTPPKIPEKPDVGYRSVGALIADNEAIVIPADSSGVVQFEGELVAVIGKKAKHVQVADALDYVLGYTIGNDISERSWQSVDRTIWRSKNADTFKPMGPWIETDIDLAQLTTRIRLNGNQVSEFKTDRMIFGVAQYIAEITRFVTMHPGDVLWMGAQAPSLDMRAGDFVEVEIDGIGTLRNHVVAERQ
jgi:2-keto-4-pentenoate hydratase/2-oxohepta-3-ene-1,7-dioic acid hydratase in catechol pathway